MDTTLLLTRRALPAVALACAAVLASGCSSSSKNDAAGDASAPSVTGAPAPPPSSAPASAPSPTDSPAPAGPGPCPTRSLKVKLGVSQGTAGSVYTTIVFTNISNVTCTLYGYPGVSMQTARPLQQIGKPAKENPATPRALVTLQPQTTANALLRIVNAGNYPASTCGPTTAHYLQVYPPNQTAAAYITYNTQGCSKPVRLMTVDVVKPGSGSS